MRTFFILAGMLLTSTAFAEPMKSVEECLYKNAYLYLALNPGPMDAQQLTAFEDTLVMACVIFDEKTAAAGPNALIPKANQAIQEAAAKRGFDLPSQN